MKLRDTIDGSSRFEGDRALRWRKIPAAARIVSARATVTPFDAELGGPFAELLAFNGPRGEFGSTRTTAGVASPAAAWVEVDFHKRRTISRVAGTFDKTTLQVDVGGGTYVEINSAGAFKTPSDVSDFVLGGDSADLPHLTVARLKLTNKTAAAPALTSVTVSSVPANVSLRVGELAPFWTHPGEMTEKETGPDFAAVLQAALSSARVENGFYDLPLVIHSDTIARLRIDLEVEFLIEQNPLPDGLKEVVLPFDFSTLADSPAATLKVEAPPNTRVVPGKTTARVRGNFAETRVAYGATGEVKPAAAVEVSPEVSQAQSILFEKPGSDITATAIDLLLESKTSTARLRLDVRRDLDGKPDDISLLAAPVEIEIDQQAGKGARWTSVQLTSEFVFSGARAAAGAAGRPQRYWVVLQSLEGTAAWSVAKADPGALNMQSTRDGSLSWRDSIAMAGTLRDVSLTAAGPLAAFFRLRTQPKTFKMPLELQAGRDKSEVRVKLDRFEPLGRVDFSLDTELARAINESLAKAPRATGPETEHLHNSDFEQWLSVGSKISPQPEILFTAPITAPAFSPDGTRAYVLIVKPGANSSVPSQKLLVVDVDCNRQIENRAIEVLNSLEPPIAFVITPDGTRAYVTNGPNVQAINLLTDQAIGVPFTVGGGGANDLAISPDGAFLYIAVAQVSSGTFIRVFDIALLEEQLASGTTPSPSFLGTVPFVAGQTTSPTTFVVSPDGTLLYLLINSSLAPNAVILIVDCKTLRQVGAPIDVGPAAITFALSPDGRRAVVAHSIDKTVSVVDTARKTAIKVATANTPVDVAISPDGTKAFVLNGDRVSVIDLGRNFVVEDFALPAKSFSWVARALTPSGDQLYVAANQGSQGSGSSILPIQFGARLPAEWQLTSGAVTPFCLSEQFHLVAVMGSGSKPTGLSQVVPVAQSFAYEFSFWGIARNPDTNESPAIAEVLWLGGDCKPVGPNPDPVPIKETEVLPEGNVERDPAAFLFAPVSGQTASLQLHRVRLAAPEGANQAEVRFTVPTGGAAAIDLVSLIATSETLANVDLKTQKDGRLVGWTLSPALAPGFTVLNTDAGVQLRNAGAQTAELAQSVAAKGGETFDLEVRGKALAVSPSQANPRVELRWLKADGTATGSPTVVEIVFEGIASAVATGAAPGDAATAEVHLVVPAKTTLAVERVSLRFSTPTIVPVTFISQAPGELILSDVRIAFEEIKVEPPPVPDRGLCIPTPPGREPGETSHDCCFCPQCESEQEIVESKDIVTPAGRPAVLARCDKCGDELVRIGGGAGILGAQPAALMRAAVSQPVVINSAALKPGKAAPQPEEQPLGLTDIPGIGEARARQLAEINIDSVEKLAASTPEAVAQIKFITVEMAARLVAGAGSALEERRSKDRIQ